MRESNLIRIPASKCGISISKMHLRVLFVCVSVYLLIPEEVPEEEYDPRSLFERLQEQKDKKQEEYEEQFKFSKTSAYSHVFTTLRTMNVRVVSVDSYPYPCGVSVHVCL